MGTDGTTGQESVVESVVLDGTTLTGVYAQMYRCADRGVTTSKTYGYDGEGF
jgi:hypothetical protein